MAIAQIATPDATIGTKASNNLSIRRLGAAGWRNLHKLAYPAVLLGALHFIWLRKGFQLEPMLYMAGIILLLALRAQWKRRRAAA